VDILMLLDKLFSRIRPEIAVTAPVVVFLVLDGAAQVALRGIWGGPSILLWEWSAFVVPLLVFTAAYLVAIVALTSQMKRLGWWRLLDSNQSLDTIRSLSWRDFERLVAAAFAAKGWSAELVGQHGPDGGTDLLLRKGKQRAIVQCKQRRFPGAYVEAREIREFVGVITAGKLMKGFFVTSGVFTPEATEFAAKVPQLELVDGADLLVMFGHCPKCRGSLEPKRGRYGVFLSCVRYPDCDGALNLAA
jgi:restriction system protein